MAAEPWTWQLPPAGDEQGIEGYRVVDRWERPVGHVRVLVERGGDVYAIVRSGSPLKTDNRAVRLEDIALVDHASCTLRLAIPRQQLEQCLPLSPRHAVTDQPADAVRLTALSPLASVGRAPVQAASRSPFAPTLFLSGAGLLALLALILLVTTHWASWESVLFSIPAVLFFLALVLACRGALEQ